MANNIQAFAQMADDTAVQITGSYQEWTAFLTTAARLYKYPFNEQLLIYAQRPDATACAGYDLWNKRMGRYVRRGSKGIALIDMTGDSPKIKYVFDVSDTGRTDRSRSFNLWEYQPEHKAAVSAMLENRYAATGEHVIEEQLEKVAAQLADEYWNDHQYDILNIVDDSFLEGYDDFNVGVAFRNAATVSITYSLLSRCGLEPDDYFEHEDFLSIFDWNTPAAVTELGTAVSTINQEVLRQIEVTIKQYEREKSAERTEQHEREPVLHAERGLPDPQPDHEPAADRESGQVREDAEEVPPGEQAGILQPPVAVGDTASAPAGDRRDSPQAAGADDARTGEIGGGDGGAESQRPVEVDGADEHLQGPGGGDHSQRAGVQLNLFVPEGDGQQISLFPTETEQIQSIREAESVDKTPFAFSIPQEDIDQILRFGSNTTDSRMRIATEYMKQKSPEQLAAFLRKEFHGGFGLKGTDGDVAAWYNGDGIHLSMGLSARDIPYSQVISWEDAAARIGELLEDGTFATNVELIEAPGHERRQLAQSLWYMSHDMSENAKEMGYMPTLASIRGNNAPDETEHLAELLRNPAVVDTLISELRDFSDSYQASRPYLMRFQLYNPTSVLEQLRELTLPRREYTTDLAELSKLDSFITEDEISEALFGGSSVEGGKGRIYAYFTADHTQKEQAAFLKDEYGIGGRSHAVSHSDRSSEDHDGKGIKLQKAGCVNVELSWSNVAKRIQRMIREDKYLTPEEKAQFQQNTQRNELFDAYNDVKHGHPDDIVLYQVGDFFEMYGEDAKAVSELAGLHLTTRSIPNVGRVEMCGVPAHMLESYVERIRAKYDVTISAVPEGGKERGVYSLRSTRHEAEQAIDEQAAEPDAGDSEVLQDGETPYIPQSTEELLAQYKPAIIAAVTEDTRYRNACGHSDRENAEIECRAAVRRAVLASHDMGTIRAFSDVPEYRQRLHQEVFDETYSKLHELLRPLSQDDIDDAIRAWNGDMASKRSVVRYMEAHGREKDTAEWLAHEYGGDEGKSLFVVRQGSPESVELPWTKVQRRIAQLIQQDRFFTDEELDNFEDIDGIAIREHLESGEPSPFVERVMADVERTAAQEQDAPAAEQVEETHDEQPAPAARELTELEKKAAQIAKRYETLPMREKIGIIAQAFGCTSGEIETSPCSGKWRGTSDIFIRFDNGATLAIGNERTPQAKTARVQNEYVNAVLTRNNPEIIAASKEAALDALRRREARDNEIAAQKGLKPYTLLNVEFNDGAADPGGGYMGWYYVTLAVDGKIVAHMETGLNHDIASGKVSEFPTRENYYAAGALKDSDVDFVFDNVGFSSVSSLYSLPISEEVRERAEQTLAQRQAEQQTVAVTEPPVAEPIPSVEERRDPLAPAYQVGDTVYLDDKAFTITQIRGSSVQLNDPSLRYPVFRSESRENFERLLRRDERNNSITDYLSANLSTADGDLMEVLAESGGLLSPEEKETVSSWIRTGDSNVEIAAHLSELADARAETMELVTGETADYFASPAGLEINILDDDGGSKDVKFFPWEDTVTVLRAMYQQERNGFVHEPVSTAPDLTAAPETPANAEPVQLEIGDVQEPVPQPGFQSEPVAFYPAGENHLPFDVAIERIRIDEADQVEPENFRIMDDHLGEGGPKEKFWRNIQAITTLKQIEGENRAATPEEQHILSQYVGWGGLPDAFDPEKPAWAAEYSELKGLLTEEEYAAARASTLNAHYTSPTVIKAIYEALGNMGFTGGNILEPSMGVGNFFGLLPDNMAGSKLYGVELDSITGRIAKQLYPNADITVAGFETTDRRDFYDVAVGNVPFGQYQVNDRAYNKLGFSIHDYFFAKSIDQVRPGGVVAFVTSRYTMDKQSPEVRRYIAQRAELLGAVRLPNNAFKANAGTEVVSDIIFLQKRDRPIEIEPDWVHLGQNADGFGINSYFIDHPEMMLGTPTSESTQYGKQDFTLAPTPGADLAAQLHEAVQHIGGIYQAAELPDLGEDEAISETIPADPSVKNYSYTVVNGEVYYRENSVMVKPDLNATAKERVKGMIELRDCVQKLIGQQMDGFISDAAIARTQAELNRLYDSYTAKYGLINSRANSLAFADDSSYFLLCSLEELDEDRNLKRKADLFTRRTIKPHEVVTSVDTPVEALALSIGEKGKVDMEYMSQLCGLSEEQIYRELRGVIFLNPMYGYGNSREEKYLPADEYLSGNVREKLEWARRSAQLNPDDYTANVEALEKAQPKDLDASEIDVRLGATWIDKAYIQQFMEETFDPPYYQRRNIRVNFSEYTAEWNITGKRNVSYGDINAYMTYGTERASAYKILEETLNLRDIRIYDTKIDADGREKRVLNSKETTLAQQKQQAIKDAFQEWVWRDPDRREALVKKYNELFNSTRPREYDGQHIIFSGMNPEIQLREHQLNAVAHILYGGNTLLAHEVGAGKTFEMVAAAMESKRLGLCSKSLFAVPNHLTEQWASEFLRLYPSANILVATKKDFEPRNRKKFCARIATGDYDAVIIGHSQFEKIPVSRERQERLLYEQIDEITDGIEELKNANAERFTIKQLEKTKKNLEAKLEKLQDDSRKDDVVTFEQLGVDRLYVDEAHSFKNLFLYTKMRNVAGLSTTDAQKSSDMLMKCRYIDEITDGKGVVFATGTPVSNSMTELYTMMRYLQHDMLKRKGLTHFDCWASTFGETTTAIELAPEGTGYRARTRFAKFHNLPELMNLFKEAADIKTADQLNLPVPKAIYHNEVAQPTEIQKGMVQELSERAARVHAGLVDASEDNMLKITSDGRKLGLDQRVINPDLPDEPGSKVNLCVDNIYRIWDEGQADKLTQLVFCDLSTPKARSKAADRGGDKTAGGAELHALTAAVDKEVPADEPEFTVYDDIRSKLIARGIPAEQIAFIHDANTEVRKKELFAKVRSGQVRVLMGSTFKMGAGMNVQDRLIALHDLDCPWRPGDLEQRSGRIIRQGNMNPQVHIYRYVTEATFDAYLWQTVENKQKFISQIMTSKSPVRSCEDVDETALSYAEIKALCAGDERIKEKMDLDVDVSRLKLMRANHQSQQYKLEDKLLKTLPKQIEQDKGFIAGFEQDIRTVAEHPHPEDGFAGMTVRGDVLTDKENAGAALLDACKDVRGLEPVPVGSYRGFEMSLTLEDFGKQYILTLKGAMSHRVELGKDARGNLTRIDNVLGNIENRRQTTQEHLESLYAQVETAKEELGKPFPQEEEYKIKSARLAELNAELNIDDRTPMEALAEPDIEVAKRPRQSILAKLKAPLPPPIQSDKTKEREVR